MAGTSATDLITGNFNNIGAAVSWAAATLTLPRVVLPNQQTLLVGLDSVILQPVLMSPGAPDPGGHTYGNPAYQCFTNVMHGTDGGAGGPYNFNANTCYGSGVTPGSPTNLTGTIVPQ